MFAVAKFVTEFKTKLIIGVILIALAIAAYFAWNARGDKIDAQKETIVTQKIENGGLKETVKEQVEAAVITEKVTTEAVVEKQKVVAVHDKIQNKTTAKIKIIEDTYKAMPQTPENTVALDNETSQVMIDGLWDSYCAGDAGALRCPAPAAPAT